MFDFIAIWFDAVWSLFGIQYPGFGFTIGAVALGGLAATLGLRIIGKVTGASFSPVSFMKSVHGGNNRNIKVSEDRKGDSH